MQLSHLKRIDLREAWNHEARDFTRWLALEETLSVLGEEIGLDLKLIQTEADIGDFHVDILAEEHSTERVRKVIIENQLEITNHDHLGKIITYASGADAEIVVWIVRDVREEHRRAVDWLNEHTDEKTEFYLVRIELWQIENSPYAPKFQVICRPNDWARDAKESVERAELTETKIKQLKFWDGLRDFAKQYNPNLHFQKSNPQHWLNLSIGSSDAHLSLTVNSKENVIGVELYIPDNKELYASLLAQRVEIEKELLQVAEWMELPGKKASRIKVSYPGNLEDEANWPQSFTWLCNAADRFRITFPKYLRDS